MNFIEKIIYGMKWTMETPTNFGWFHIMFIVLIFGLTLYLAIFQRKCNDKLVRIICFSAWAICFLFEVYKQLEFSFSYDPSTGVKTWDFRWYSFPFQFCSSPLYILPFIVFLPEGKIRDSFIAYTTTFVMFAGIAVFCYPNDVFISTVMIDIQTMVHHGLQIAIGVFLLVHEQKKINIFYYLRGCIVFAGMSVVAIALNSIMYYAVPEIHNGSTFNMFFISPHFPSTLPVLSSIYASAPYPVFLLCYLIGFSAAALIVDLVYMLVKFIMRKVNESKNKPQAA